MNSCHTWRLYCSSLKIFVELENFQNKPHILVGKWSLPNKKFTSQKEVITTFVQPILTHIASPSRIAIHLKSYPNIDQYLWKLLVKFQLDPTVGFGVILNNVKLDGKNFYAKIWILACFTRLNRIINSQQIKC